ncbi:MAG: ATP-binding protein [Myxococcota bacterium]
MRQREELAAVLAHDLGQPLRAITHLAARLEERLGATDDRETRECLRGILAASSRARALVDSLHDFARIGSQPLRRAPTSLDAILDQALANLRVPLREAHARVGREPLPTLDVDGIQLVRVFQNLLENALKFRGKEPVEIEVRADRRPDGWAVAVRDRGIGLEHGRAERIFELFERGGASEDIPGTGAGLAVCERIIEAHGGRIWAEGAPGRGATFLFTLS